LTIHQATLLTQYGDKPGILDAVASDIATNPWDWIDDHDFSENIELIKEQLSLPDANGRAPAADKTESARRRDIAPGAKSTEQVSPKRRPKVPALTERQAMKILQPYRKSRDDLRLIIDLCEQLMEELR
jgi:hypothetical protein